MLWAWNVVFVCNTESIFLCVSTSEAEPPLLHITTLTTGYQALYAVHTHTLRVAARRWWIASCVFTGAALHRASQRMCERLLDRWRAYCSASALRPTSYWLDCSKLCRLVLNTGVRVHATWTWLNCLLEVTDGVFRYDGCAVVLLRRLSWLMSAFERTLK